MEYTNKLPVLWARHIMLVLDWPLENCLLYVGWPSLAVLPSSGRLWRTPTRRGYRGWIRPLRGGSYRGQIVSYLPGWPGIPSAYPCTGNTRPSCSQPIKRQYLMGLHVQIQLLLLLLRFHVSNIYVLFYSFDQILTPHQGIFHLYDNYRNIVEGKQTERKSASSGFELEITTERQKTFPHITNKAYFRRKR